MSNRCRVRTIAGVWNGSVFEYDPETIGAHPADRILDWATVLGGEVDRLDVPGRRSADQFEQWGHVGRGRHQLSARPPAFDLDAIGVVQRRGDRSAIAQVPGEVRNQVNRKPLGLQRCDLAINQAPAHQLGHGSTTRYGKVASHHRWSPDSSELDGLIVAAVPQRAHGLAPTRAFTRANRILKAQCNKGARPSGSSHELALFELLEGRAGGEATHVVGARQLVLRWQSRACWQTQDVRLQLIGYGEIGDIGPGHNEHVRVAKLSVQPHWATVHRTLGMRSSAVGAFAHRHHATFTRLASVTTPTPPAPPAPTITGGTFVNGFTLVDTGSGSAGFSATALSWQGPTVRGDVDLSLATLDATGCLVLPGMVDLHGDAFERSIMPRPGVRFDLGLALDDNDAQLTVAGITTSLLSLTDSWEPGLRSRSTMLDVIAAVEGRRGARPGPDVLTHVRHERCNTADFDQLTELVSSGLVRLLSYNDHTPDDSHTANAPTATQLARSGVSADQLLDMQEAAIGRRHLGKQHERHLAAVCDAAKCPTASHDASTRADLERDLALGVTIAEFPLSIPLAQEYRSEGIAVMLGAPNLVRGGSHLGNLQVSEAWAAGAADILVSDYHYPSLLQAPFELERLGLATLADAWQAVSTRPAELAGLTDRGRLLAGQRADIVVVEPPRANNGRWLPAKVRAVVADGHIIFNTLVSRVVA
jgi:alpha-D-ribose 1-methylphosphonate 5-triphosphate diphosphatase